MTGNRRRVNMEEAFLLWLLYIKTKPGEDVTLQCQGPEDSDVTVLKWTRSDLGSEDYVFFYREKRSYENYQHESFHSRVELRDPEMKDGDVSVILKNVDINDNGTYECYVGITGSYPRVISIVHLKVDPVQINITAEPGQTVTLPCRVPRYSNIKAVEWIRPDLMPNYVFWYQNGQSDPDFQHPSYKNRVELKDSQVKDGDVSVFMKNVKTDDTGTYKCGLLQRGTNQWMSIINLTVSQPGGAAGHKDEEHNDDENQHGNVGLAVGLSVLAIVLVVVVFLIYKKCGVTENNSNQGKKTELQQLQNDSVNPESSGPAADT